MDEARIQEIKDKLTKLNEFIASLDTELKPVSYTHLTLPTSDLV